MFVRVCEREINHTFNRYFFLLTCTRFLCNLFDRLSRGCEVTANARRYLDRRLEASPDEWGNIPKICRSRDRDSRLTTREDSKRQGVDGSTRLLSCDGMA